MRYIEGTKTLNEQRGAARRENIDNTLFELEEDYNRCYAVVRRTFDHLEKLGLREFNKVSAYKWSFDKDSSGYGYVCVRFGSSLLKKSLVKRSGALKEEDLYKWIEDKDMVIEALDEAYQYIDSKIDKLKLEMGEMKEQLTRYEERASDAGEQLNEAGKVLSGQNANPAS
ncbi:MAG: hypothetical protein LBL06_05040 [Treponema sp.]|jgi:hypothetical protein|nr:hypothetical protein [Treponema sp.]